jgi:hypothetical protein
MILTNTRQRVTGLTSTSTLSFELGISDQSTVKLDFDRVPLRLVKYWARRACIFYMLEGYIIFQSSASSYHVVFNLPVSWDVNIEIMCWVAIESQLEKLRDYVLMQGRKGSSTLRVGPKGEKPPPKIIEHARYGKQDKAIQEFLDKRKQLLSIYSKICV